MHFTLATVAAFVAFTFAAPAPLAAEAAPEKNSTTDANVLRICTYGYNYCGKDLLSIGDYKQEVIDALKGAGQPTDAVHIQETLFNCDGLISGHIQFIKYCGGVDRCVVAGTGSDDYCL